MRTWSSSAENKGTFVAGEWVMPMRRGQALDFIPFTFIGTEGVTPDVSKPPMVDLADVSIGHYRNSADHEHGLFYTAIPTYWASGVPTDSALRVGPVVWRLGENSQAGVLEFSGAGLGAIREAMGRKERLMATLGARLLEDVGGRPVTATEIKIHHSGDSASLRSISGAAAAGMTRILRWHVWWFTGTGEMPEDVKVELPTDFFQVKATPDEVRAGLEAVQKGQMSYATFYANLQKGQWARDGVSAEEELAEIEAEAGYRENAAAMARTEAALTQPPPEPPPAA